MRAIHISVWGVGQKVRRVWQNVWGARQKVWGLGQKVWGVDKKELLGEEEQVEKKMKGGGGGRAIAEGGGAALYKVLAKIAPHKIKFNRDDVIKKPLDEQQMIYSACVDEMGDSIGTAHGAC